MKRRQPYQVQAVARCIEKGARHHPYIKFDILALPEKVWVDFRMNWAESRTNAGFHGF
jgi:hypothetical protein